MAEVRCPITGDFIYETVDPEDWTDEERAWVASGCPREADLDGDAYAVDEDYHCDLSTCDCGFQCDDPEVMDAHENHGAGCNRLKTNLPLTANGG